MAKWSVYCGISGVAEDENNLARSIGRNMGYVVILAVMWMAVQWYLEMTSQISHDLSLVANFVIWMLFVIESAVLCFFVNDKLRYLYQNWLNVFIILAGAVMLFSEYEPLISLLRSFRIFLVVGLLVPRLVQLKKFITNSRLEYTLLIIFVTTLLSGILITQLDPVVHDISHGIWWAWVNLTGTSYGIYIPETVSEKILSGALIIIRFGLIANFTANLVIHLMEPTVSTVISHHKTNTEKLLSVEEELTQLTSEEGEAIRILRDLQARMRRLEDLSDGNNNTQNKGKTPGQERSYDNPS